MRYRNKPKQTKEHHSSGRKTIHEAMFYCHHLELACKTQIAILSSGVELVIPNTQICHQANHDLLNFEKDLGLRAWQAWTRWVRNN